MSLPLPSLQPPGEGASQFENCYKKMIAGNLLQFKFDALHYFHTTS